MIGANSFRPIEPVSSFEKFRLMQRLRKIGGILMTLHNVLMMEAPYDLLEKLFRKCCVRRVFCFFSPVYMTTDVYVFAVWSMRLSFFGL